MLFVDINGLCGVHVRHGKREIDIVRFSSEDEIFGFPDEDKRAFFSDFFSFKFFDLPFGGKKAKSTIEIELSQEDMKETEKYIAYVPKKKGTSFAIIYDSLYCDDMFSRGFSEILFKPVCLLSFSKKIRDGIFVDIDNNFISLAYQDKDFVRLGAFRYLDVDDIKFFANLMLSQVSRDDLNFYVCGPKYEIFPFEAKPLIPSDIFTEINFNDPAFTSIFAALFGNYPPIKISKVKSESPIEVFLDKSLPHSITFFLSVVLFSLPVILDYRLQKEKRDKILNEISEVFKSTFPDKNAVDPYEQMKIEYSKLKAREQNASALITFFDFAQMVSDYVIRIEDFRSEDGEISAELRIADLGSIDSVKNALSKLLDDIKITSTVRSRDGNAFIMRLTGTLKGKSAGKTKMKKEEELENKRGEEKFL
jgi:hypothetical protein